MEESNFNYTSTGNDLDIKPLQSVLTRFAKEFDLFCSNNGITYYLMGGTALGAIRHKGFIPWDDDFDVFMDRKNYLRFLYVCKSKLDSSKYYLQREDTDEWPLFFSKIRLNNTLYIEREEEVGEIHTGLYIDVMCLHNTFTKTWIRYLHFVASRILSAKALSKRGYNTDSSIKRLALFTAKVIISTPVKALLLKFVRSLDGQETDFVGHFFGRAPFRYTSFPRRYLGTPRRVPFEGESLPVPSQVEKYLSLRFGPNYMKVPNQETRNSFPSHLIFYDLGPYA